MAVGEAASGRGSAVLVEGEPGIGKSALLDWAASRCAGLGMRVLRAGGEELEQELPFATVGACLDVLVTGGEPERARVAGLLRGEGAGRRPGSASHDFVVTEAMLDLVDRWCAAGPVAVIVDDVQWADVQSIVVLHRLCRGIEQYPLLVVLAAQLGPRGEAVAALVRSMQAKGARQVTLGPVAPEAVPVLVEAVAGAAAGPRLMNAAAAAGGHPLYVTELVAGLAREGRLQVSDGVAEITDTGVADPPQTLREVILSRLAPLAPQAQAMMRKAAVLGAGIDLSVLAAVLEVPVLELADVLASATAVGLLAGREDHLQFRHDLIRQVLADDVPGPVRELLRQRAAQALMASGADIEHVAEHLAAVGGGQYGNWLLAAAPELTIRAPKLAVTLLRSAIDGADTATAAALKVHLIRALLWDGGSEEAEQMLHHALSAGTDPTGEAELLPLLMDAYFRQGRLDEAASVAAAAARLEHLEPVRQGRLYGFAAACLLFLGQPDASEHAADQALRAGLQTGDAISQVYGYNTLAGLRLMQNRVDEAVALNTDAMTVFERAKPILMLDPLIVRALCFFAQERLEDLDTVLVTAARRNRDTGGVYLTMTYLIRANLWFLQGRWDDALAEVRTGLDSPDPLRQAPALHGLAAMIGIHRGETSAIDADLASLLASSPLDTRFTVPLRWAHALAEEVRDGPQHALDLLYPLWEQPLPFNPRCIGYRMCADLARLAYAAGDIARLQALVDTTAALLPQQPTASLNATVALCRGLTHDDTRHLLAAAESFAAAGWPLHEAYSREHAATVFARHGQSQPARDELARALTLYTSLDAATDIARARARARQAGIRHGVRGPRGRPKHGWAALSETEHKVALAVAEGRSNPDIAAQMFLSPRTVQSHVSSILAKLGLRSRVEIALSAIADQQAPR
ncbi:LuxR C-terminal-related transcriptional regulator [Catellatospora sp. NEAU-YM18]|nr:LuxR C-terminal-related transcriptional regulator [Catellatospora tritici]